MKASLQITKQIMITSWAVTIICAVLYVGLGTYASVGLGYDSTDALGFAPKWIRGCVTFACTCGFIGTFAGAPMSIVSTIIYYVKRKQTQKKQHHCCS